jgi:hypothetical protein
MNKAPLSDPGALRLHSRYNPSGEAGRYLDALNLPDGIDYFILLEPGLGYLIPLLKKKHPGAKVVALHADCAFRNPSPETAGTEIPSWFPDSGLTVQQFLEKEIPDSSSIRLIEWRPSLHVYGEGYLSVLSETVDFIKRADANARTEKNFGRRWLKNFFRNISLMRTALLFRPAAAPVVITGSGPSLEESFPSILEMRKEVFILASSSSLPALEARGLGPDLVISTDGGSWAPLHLFAWVRNQAARRGGAADRLLAINPCAAVPSQCGALPFLVLSDGSLWQNLILRELGVPSLVIPQRGTVTASALELALNLSSGNIYLAGMDLSVRDLRSHARPYGFDHLLYGRASRLNPVYSQTFTRSNEIRGGRSHEVYASWFKSRLETLPDRIFSLEGNHPVFKNLPKALPAASGTGAVFRFREFPLGPGGAAIDLALGALDRAFGDPRFSEILQKELSPLLGGTDGADSTRKEIRNLAAAYGEKRRG